MIIIVYNVSSIALFVVGPIRLVKIVFEMCTKHNFDGWFPTFQNTILVDDFQMVGQSYEHRHIHHYICYFVLN